jgi:hypothetical protein
VSKSKKCSGIKVNNGKINWQPNNIKNARREIQSAVTKWLKALKPIKAQLVNSRRTKMLQDATRESETFRRNDAVNQYATIKPPSTGGMMQ